MLNLAMSGALWLLMTLIPVLFFYFLRTRFRQQPVSSVYIWARLADNLRGRNQIRKRTLWLLMLQIATVLAAVLALAQPFWVKQHLAQPGMVFLIDVSASMAAVDNTGTNRLTRARLAFEAELAKLPRGAKTMVFLCDQNATPLGESGTPSRTILRRLQQATVRGGEFNETAVSQKVQAWLNSQKQPWQACLISDGGLDLGGQQLSRLFEGAFKFIPVGNESANLGVAGLRFINPAMVQFSVNNGSLTKQPVTVVLENERKVIGEIHLKVPSGLSRHVLKLRQRFGTGVYTIRFKNHRDALAMDDRYFLAVNPVRKARVLLAGEPNPFLAAAFRHPGIELTQWRRLPTEGFSGAEWDLIVIDRVPFPAGIKTNLLVFNRIPPGASVKLSPLTPGVMRTADTSHPLLRFVDWQQVRVTAGNSIHHASGAQILAYVNRQPLIAVWENQYYRTVMIGTDLFHSDLGLSAAFPIFIQNLIQWCVPQNNNLLAYNQTVGVPVRFAENTAWNISPSDGLSVERQGPLVTVTALQPGIYRWEDGSGRRGALAANPHFSESDITPRTLQLGETVKLAAELTTDRTDLLRWVLAGLLICLSGEWLLWRGGGLPGRRETP